MNNFTACYGAAYNNKFIADEGAPYIRGLTVIHFDGLMQVHDISSALAMEIP